VFPACLSESLEKKMKALLGCLWKKKHASEPNAKPSATTCWSVQREKKKKEKGTSAKTKTKTKTKTKRPKDAGMVVVFAGAGCGGGCGA
jgi:menaquinone-dependent protoporphyrinogen IX oxidase